MDVDRLADLIRAQTRVRVGSVEGVLDGFTVRTAWLVVDGERVEVPIGVVEELEPLDEAKAQAVRTQQADQDRQVVLARLKARAADALVGLDAPALRDVLRDALSRLDSA